MENKNIRIFLADNKNITSFIIFLALFFCSIVYLAYFRSLCETLEAESAAIAREYLKGTPLLINYLNGMPDFDKPPLYYWLIAIFAKIIPSWELAARVPSILAIVIFLILFFLISKELIEKSHEFFMLWSFIFLTCPKIFWMSQVARMDLFFNAICFVAIFFFYKMLTEFIAYKTFSNYYLFFYFLFAALSVMIKGPLGAIIIFIPSLIYLLIYQNFSLIKKIFFNKYLFIFIIIAVPWYIYAIIQTDFSFFVHFFIQENLSRFTNLIPSLTLRDFNHSPSYRYFIYLLIGFFPWSLLIPYWIYKDLAFLKNRKLVLENIFFIYFLFIFIFFSISLSKRSDYILLIYPIISFFIASFIYYRRLLHTILTISGLLLALCLLCCALLFLTNYIIINKFFDSIYFTYFKNIFLIYWLNFSILFIISILISLNKFQKIFYTHILIGLLFFTLSIGPLFGYYKGKDLRIFCKKIEPIIKNKKVYFIGSWEEQSAFYLKRVIKKISLYEAVHLLSQPQDQVFFLIKEDKLQGLLKIKDNINIIKSSNTPLLPLFLISSS